MRAPGLHPAGEQFAAIAKKLREATHPPLKLVAPRPAPPAEAKRPPLAGAGQ